MLRKHPFRFKAGILAGCFLFFTSLSAQTGDLIVLHTNDMHSQFEPVPAGWVPSDPKPLIGGMEALSAAVRSVRAGDTPVLLLDGGDILTGTPLSDITVNGVKGGGFLDMMNLLDYDAMVIGNHEFDNGLENLKRLFRMAEFPVLSANLFYRDSLLAPAASVIIRKGALRIGIIGWSPPFLYDVAAHKHLTGIRVSGDVADLQRHIDALDPQTDLIVLLTHQGFLEDTELAKNVKRADLIVGGHSHTRLPEMLRVNGMLVLQAGSRAENLGWLSMTVQGDTLSRYDYRLVPLWADSLPPDPEMGSRVQAYRNRIQEAYGQVIGTLKTGWVRNHSGESNLGNYIADAMRKTADADFAVLNSGGIRKNLPAGPVRKLDIVEILPFTNYLMTFRCTGEQLLRLMQTNARAASSREGVLQISGISYAYRKTGDGNADIPEARIGGQPVDPDSVYTGVTVDYVLQGNARRYFGFVPDRMENLGVLVSDAVIETILGHPEIHSEIEGRMKRL